MRIDKEKLREALSIEIVQELLDEFGGNSILKDDDTIVARTICHNHSDEDASHKMYYYDDSKLFVCYTNCGSFDVYDMLIKVIEAQTGELITFPAALRFLNSRMGGEGYDFFEETQKSSTLEMIQLLDRILGDSEEVTPKEQLKEYEAPTLKNMPQPRIKDWEDEGIDYETIKKFNIRFDPISTKIVIPHYDKNNRLVGIRGRALIYEEAERYGKYMPLYIQGKMYNHPLGFNLYGLNETKENIRRTKTAILFEAEKSVLLADMYMDLNISAAVCGSNISNFQINELLELGVTEIIIAFDRQYKEYKDKECLEWMKKIKRLADRHKNYVSISVVFDTGNNLGYRDAPIDCGKEVFNELLKNRVPVR